jgi:4-amino-4-deoxy-L-arabinose transferase-like glycosyltransferase
MASRTSTLSFDLSNPWSLALAHPRIVLTVLCLLLYLPGLGTLPPLDRDESRFTQSTKQMIETGDFVQPRLQEEARNKKPVGIYWMQAITAEALSGSPYNSVWAYRIPSVLGAIFAVLFVFGIGAKLYDRETGLVAGGLMASSLLLIGEAHIAKTDAVLCACTTGAQLMIAHFFVAARQGAPKPPLRYSIGLGVALGLAILVKGPIAPLVCGLTIIGVSLWEGRWGWFWSMRPILAFYVIVLMNVPWLVAIMLVTKGQFMVDAFGNDFAAKLVGAEESHWGPPGYYLVSLLIGFWPGWLFLIPAGVYAWARRHEGAVRFLLSWLVPAWILIEFAPTKLPHYPLPLYPAIALLCAAAVMAAARESRNFLDSTSVKLGAALWLLMTFALLGALMVYVPNTYGTGSSAFLWILAVPVIIAAGFALIFLVRLEGEKAAAAAVATGGVLAVAAFAGVLPTLDHLMVSKRAAQLVISTGTTGDKGSAVAAAGYHEPSLVFQIGTKMKLAKNGAEAADFLATTPNALVLVEKSEETSFHQRLNQQLLQVEQLGQPIVGLNYSKGKQVTLTLYRLHKAT